MLKVLRKIFLTFCVTFFLVAMAGLGLSAISGSHRSDLAKELELFVESLDFIQTCYVSETKSRDLVYGAISGMVSSLDPHSQFLTPEEYEELKIDTQGKFGGIGVEITIKDGLITVIAAIEDTPAARAGMRTHDRIIKIDGDVVKNFTLSETVKRLRGKPGTTVEVVAWREKAGKLLSFKIKRAVIDVKDIKSIRMFGDHIGYIRLVNFSDQASVEMDKALKDLKKRGAKGLIVDLRNNPGGVLDKAVVVTDHFLAKGLVIVTVKGREEKNSEIFRARGRSNETSLPMVLLINEGSASGSEIMAGALQDNKRAILIGTKTFGKGSVQSVLELKDDSAIKLTTAAYLTPSGRSIHVKGIEPDIFVESEAAPPLPEVKETQVDLEAILTNPESVVTEDSESLKEEARQPDPSTDAQLRRSVEFLNEKISPK
jgi:carboxyl-terminal processing protease